MAFLFAHFTRCGFGLALALFAAPVFAWGAQGHRLVGALAEAELTPAARADVAKLLAGEPEPSLGFFRLTPRARPVTIRPISSFRGRVEHESPGGR